MKKLEPKSTEWVYINEEYEVCSSNGCCVIGKIYLDLFENEWVFDIATRESAGGTIYYSEEIEEINYLLNKLNKRDKFGKYKSTLNISSGEDE